APYSAARHIERVEERDIPCLIRGAEGRPIGGAPCCPRFAEPLPRESGRQALKSTAWDEWHAVGTVQCDRCLDHTLVAQPDRQTPHHLSLAQVRAALGQRRAPAREEPSILARFAEAANLLHQQRVVLRVGLLAVAQEAIQPQAGVGRASSGGSPREILSS